MSAYNFPLFARYSCVAGFSERKTRSAIHVCMTSQNGMRFVRLTDLLGAVWGGEVRANVERGTRDHAT